MIYSWNVISWVHLIADPTSSINNLIRGPNAGKRRPKRVLHHPTLHHGREAVITWTRWSKIYCAIYSHVVKTQSVLGKLILIYISWQIHETTVTIETDWHHMLMRRYAKEAHINYKEIKPWVLDAVFCLARYWIISGFFSWPWSDYMNTRCVINESSVILGELLTDSVHKGRNS